MTMGPFLAGTLGAIVRAAIGLLVLVGLAAAGVPAHADEAALRTTIAKFAAAKNFSATEAVVRELGATGDPAVGKVLTALSEGDLSLRKAGGGVFIAKESGGAV